MQVNIIFLIFLKRKLQIMEITTKTVVTHVTQVSIDIKTTFLEPIGHKDYLLYDVDGSGGGDGGGGGSVGCNGRKHKSTPLD